MRYAKYIGRLSGFAIALGAGVSIATSPGVALATPAESHSDSAADSSSSSTSASGSGSPSAHAVSPRTTSTSAEGITSSPETLDGRNRGGAAGSASHVAPAKAVDETVNRDGPANRPTKRTTQTKGGAQASPAPMVRAVQPTSPTYEANSAASTAPGRANSAEKIPAPANNAPDKRIERQLASTPTHLSSAQTTAVAAPIASQQVPAALASSTPASTQTASLMSGVRSWLGLGGPDLNGPQAPSESPTMWAVLAWTRRQLGQSQSGAASVANVESVQTTQVVRAEAVGRSQTAVAAAAATISPPKASTPTLGTPDPVTGAITGSLNVTDPNGNKLTYTVSAAPAIGFVTVQSTGSFVYTPTQSARLLAGESLTAVNDTFVVAASNGSSSTTVNVTVPIFTGALTKATTPISVGNSPSGVVTFGSRIYVANTLSNSVTAIDANTNAVIATVPVGRAPTQLALSPDGSVLYAVNSGSGTVSAVSTVNGSTIRTMTVGASPRAIAVDSSGSRIYVTNTGSNTVTVLNAANGANVATISVGTAPTGVVVSPDGTRVYVANRSSGTLSVIDTATNRVVATMGVGSMPQALALNSAGTRLYVTNSGSNNVSVLDTSIGKTIATISVRSQPYGIAISPDGSLAYVVNSDSTISVINTQTNTKVTGTLPIETGTGSMIAFSPDGSRVYVTNSAGSTIRSASLSHFAPPPAANPSSLTSAVTDNFTGPAGTAPNPDLWSNFLSAGGTDGQLEAYTNSTRNAALDGNGNLVITAIQEPVTVPGYGTFPYSSAFLTTQGKLDFTYGTVAARIQFPSGQGLWPAFWMLGSDIQTVGWPQGGEIDIMELAGSGTSAYAGSTLHGPGGYSLPVAVPSKQTAGFHTYWMRWAPNSITTGIDNTTIATYTPDSLPPGVPWTFNDRSMYIILNMAVGGPAGPPSSSTQFPAQMVVDSVSYTPLTTTT